MDRGRGRGEDRGRGSGPGDRGRGGGRGGPGGDRGGGRGGPGGDRGGGRGGGGGGMGRGDGGRGGGMGRGDGGRGGGGGGGRGGGGYGDGGRGRGGYSGGGDGGGRGGGGRGDFVDRGGGGRGGGGFRGRGAPPKFYDANACPDPYIHPKTYTPEQTKLQIYGWKPLPETRDDVVIQQYTGKPASWALKTINVSVNHFPVESTKGPKSFPFPELYHYDISYEMIRKKRAEKAEPPQEKPAGPSKKKKGGKGGPVTVESVAAGLAAAGISEKKPKGDKPPNKTLPRNLTKLILDYLIPKIRAQYGLQGIATDGSYNMYSMYKFHEAGFRPPKNPNPGTPFPMQHDVPFAELKRVGLMEEEDDSTARVMFDPSMDKRSGGIHTVNVADIARFYQANGTLKGFNFSAELRQTLESACNTFVKSLPNFNYFSVGRSTMVRSDQDPRDTCPLGGGLVAWRGVAANIAMGWKPYLNVDIANCAFILDKYVLDVVQEIIRSNPSDVNSWKHTEFDEVKSFLKTCKVSYMIDGHKFGGPIRDLGDQSVSNSQFKWEEKGKMISVFNYYKERYGKTLTCPNGPVLIIRKSAMIPAELCTIKKGQSYNRKLDGNQTTNMLTFAKKNPGDLEADIEKQIRDMKLKQNEVLKQLGISIPEKMLSIEARVLVPPTLRYGGNRDGKIAHVEPEEGTWEIWSHDFAFYKTVHVEKWGVLVVASRGIQNANDRALWAFIECLKNNGRSKGVVFKTDPHVYIDTVCKPFNQPDQNRQALVKAFKGQFTGCELVVVVFPKKGCSTYGHIKHAAEVDAGILTQCVAERNVVPFAKDATVQNILLKINSKLGGINHVTVAPFDAKKASMFSSLIMDCPLLVLGADVTHAPPGSKKFVNGKEFIMPSYAAVTGSLDKTCMPFMTEVHAQRKANAGAAEVIQNLDDIVKKMLETFKDRSGVVPKKIIYFRDGVGEGQFPEVLHIEMTAIRKACSLINAKYQPKITFITVQKRHKTRIFYHNPNGRTENAPAGTVIDKEIVHPSETDFYLCSHKGMLGTSRPSRYHVLWDDSDFPQDVIQSLAYTLCYMYVRCTKSVKMPAPTYYAHLAAERAKKLCEGFETNRGEPTEANLNLMLARHVDFIRNYPMHFI